MSQHDLSQLIIDSRNRKFAIKSVRVEGAVHTSDALLERITTPLLHAATLGDVVVGTRNVGDHLRRMGIFKTVGIVLDSPPGVDDAVNVVFQVEEAQRLFARTGADFGANDGSMNLSLNLRNIFGGAETLSANTSYAIDTSGPIYNKDSGDMAGASSHQAIFTTPIDADPNKLFEATGFQHSRNHTLTMSHHEKLTGVSLKLKNLGGLAKQEFSYDATWRENHDLASTASMSIRKDAGNSLKSSVSHTISFDSRDDPALPYSGLYLKAFQEVAGLGGDVRHIKGEADGQAIIPLLRGFSIATSLRGGLIVPWGGTSPRNRVNDRFFLGGPLSVRGFRQAGIGPKHDNDVLGGDLYWASGLSLLAPIPLLPMKPIKAQFFVNGGSLVPLDLNGSPSSNVQTLFGTPSICAGIGIAARFTIFRLEVNYSVPLTMCTTDSRKPGIQFGIGMNFM
ncbi:hypothetical protein BASA50_001473 [Batrachochytrium salamandrivorans]|uniref:Bacterial surface antigen (D15) domain-containing protein n=1 Tax=Batrachochytrium salamandrivorans TaxID=1357716 RepID=A0ABQ8FNY9_9FUNG|nr:hypothetical protein BASA62_007849 [Batrachochytrium salamandrivorans]KAH6583531.1 hypothetical protein BASA60_001415 [Batrachochytrium salamandrivorans]KAH6596705.1 hypothetical protein BASA61_003399 [Batrachochytrium salamandrivorans]KAH6601615.1 hypothetical protein BASA50_001473 [Batrachochytrium salamandrivorans]KAH9250684.1 hypothetical protein BASA81_011536 [Batrachochytrium salamandrivorans]